MWKEIPGFPYYEVSETGEIRSWKKKGRGVGRREEPLLLKQARMNGYRSVLVMRGGKSTRLQVHRAVLLAFVGPPPEGKTDVDHLDDDREHNHVDNLEWVSKQENRARTIQRGRHARGEAVNTAKLTRAAVKEIRDKFNALEAEMAAKHGVGVTTIRKVCQGLSWKHLTSSWVDVEGGPEGRARLLRSLRENLEALIEAARADRAASWREIASRCGVDVPEGQGGLVANIVRDNTRRKGLEYPGRERSS